MKILVVDDDWGFVGAMVAKLQQGGLEVDGIVAGYGMNALDGQDLSNENVLDLIRNADVIFLDHNMPSKNGEEILNHWEEEGIDFSTKRVVGTSSMNQPYLCEQLQIGWKDIDAIKSFLGLD